MSHPKNTLYLEATHGVTPGSIVCCRNRDWVLLPSDSPDVHVLRPLTGATEDIVALHRQLTDFIGYDLPEERLRSATFPLPSPDDLADAASAWPAYDVSLRERIKTRAAELERSHKRVRQIVSLRVRALTVTPQLPPDVLGLLLLQPVVWP
jgi:hypothetical protein